MAIGTPVLFSSVVHGTVVDSTVVDSTWVYIAGKGIADPAALTAAIGVPTGRPV